jgi:hypothetical protein
MDQNTIGSFFHSLTYVVTDVGRAAERFSALVPGAVFSTHRIRMEPIGILAIEAGAAELECAAAAVGPRGEYEVRLWQPLSHDPLFHWSLTIAGPGLHHVGLLVADLESVARKVAGNGPAPIELHSEDGERRLFCRCEPLGGLIELTEMPAKAPRPPVNKDRSLTAFSLKSRTW